MSEALIDISALVGEIKSHRFDGYSPVRIADEIDRFRAGAGTGSLTEAVDALGQVATALTETEETLRVELGKLGVSWHGAASESASRAVTTETDFSQRMAATLDGAARSLYAQGDAFNRTRDKLPGSDEVRKAVGGTSLGDEVMSLIGFETDHAEQVAAAREATQHAVQILNEYATASGDNLGSVDTGAEPRTLGFSVAPHTPALADPRGEPIPAGAGPGAAGSPAGTTPTTATDGAIASSGAPTTPGSAPAGAAHPDAFAAGTGADSPTPPAGIAAPVPSGGDQHHTPSTGTAGAAAPAPGATTPAGLAGGGNYGGYANAGAQGGYPGTAGDARPFAGRVPVAQAGGPAPGQAAGRGRVIGRVTVPNPGAQAPTGGVINKPYTPLSQIGPGSGAQEAPLARGRMSGLVAQPPSGGSAGAFPVARARAGLSATDIGAGAAAIGAGGAAGAMSGAGERRGRGVGRSAPNAVTSERQMSFGSDPGEDEAEAAERAESMVAPETGDPDGGP